MNRITRAITGTETYYRYEPPHDINAKVILLTTGKVATIGTWGNGEGIIAWAPLPKRNKKLEEELRL